MKKISGKARVIISDSIWSIIAIAVMNMVAQFAVYPFLAARFGEETYGDILYLLSYINIIAVSGGSALNYARITSSASGKTENGEYNLILLILCGIALPFSFAVRSFGGMDMPGGEVWLFWGLLCMTMFRNYIDVDFRLDLNYKGYFWYYMAVSVGYLLGIVLCKFTGRWELALLPGEVFGVLFVLVRGGNLNRRFAVLSPRVKDTVTTAMIMLGTNFLLNLIFNADRLMLKMLISGSAVTIYYLATLLGKTVSLITTPLNSVIISYLAKYEGGFTKAMFRKVLLIIFGAIVVLVLGCVAASYVLIGILYPESFEATKPFFFISSLSQVIFFATTVLTVVLLRFAKQRYQLYINLIYALAFAVLGIPMTKSGGIWGFSYAILIANVVRLCASVGFGLLDQRRRTAKTETVQTKIE